MPTSAQYWRLLVNGATTGAGHVQVYEFQLLDTNNTNLAITLSPTYTASSTSGTNTASKAFDANSTTCWESNANPSSGSPEWVQAQFSAAQNIVAAAIITNNYSTAPVAFKIQSSPDGTTWTDQFTATAFSWPTSYPLPQTAYFSVSTTVGNVRASQVAVEEVYTGNSNVRTSQLATEVVYNAQPIARVSTEALEIIYNAQPNLHMSQIAIEVLFPYVPSSPVPIYNFLLP